METLPERDPAPTPTSVPSDDARLLAVAMVGACVVGVVSGAASALFLLLLDKATHVRTAVPALVYALPFAGLLLGALYDRFGKAILPGNNLVIGELAALREGRTEGARLPLRMAPMVLLATVATHLFGGSAGREGTAVQMGASLADQIEALLGRWVAPRHRASLREALLTAGVAGGFGSVFGTPVAGAVFALEFVRQKRPDYRSLLPALLSGTMGDFVARALGTTHTDYGASPLVALTPLLFLKWCAFAGAVAAVALAFVRGVHGLKSLTIRYVHYPPLRLFAGGTVVVMLWKITGTGEYLGLGVPGIVRSFSDPSLPFYAFAAKALFTAVTLGSGFQGGEVTPLFFVGAALGNACAPWLGVPTELAAGVGLAALFGAASKAPLALVVMAVELLGGHVLPHVAVVTFVAYVLTGRASIYSAQAAP